MTDRDSRLAVLIVDDELHARAGMRRLVASDEDLVLVDECASASEAIASIRRRRPDLLLLDVRMPGGDGFSVLDALGDDPPLVILVTAHDEFTLRAFDAHALDYLLKPFSDERFASALARAKRQRALEAIGGRRELLDSLADALSASQHRASASTRHLRKFTVRRAGRREFVGTNIVEWIEADEYCVRLHTAEGSHHVRGHLGRFEVLLDPTEFARIHRSAIVRLDAVRTLEPGPNGATVVLLESGQRLPVSRSRLPELKRRLDR